MEMYMTCYCSGQGEIWVHIVMVTVAMVNVVDGGMSQTNPLFKVELRHSVSNGAKNAVSIVSKYNVSLGVDSPAEV